MLLADAVGTVIVDASSMCPPPKGTWSPIGGMSTSRGYATAALLCSGKVLVVGDRNSEEVLATVEFCTPTKGT
jgi:hypothetical protein